jgi:outer membrane lipoprotein carrier protein
MRQLINQRVLISKVKMQQIQKNKRAIFALVFMLTLFGARLVYADTALSADLEARYDTLKSWQADFNQTTHVEILNQKLKKQGFIAVARPNKIHISYHNPAKTYVSNGKKLWIYKDDKTALQFNKPKKIISKEALSFLSGLQNLSKLFDVKKTEKNSTQKLGFNNKKLSHLDLIPKDDLSAVIKITLGIDSKEHIVKEAILYNVSGNITHYEFNKLAFDLNLDPTLFTLPGKKKRKIIRR